jgi:hypothetical protein
MDTRLINQVVEWQWKIKIENEKQNMHHADISSYFPIALEYCGKAIKSISHYFVNLYRNRVSSIHLSEVA